MVEEHESNLLNDVSSMSNESAKNESYRKHCSMIGIDSIHSRPTLLHFLLPFHSYKTNSLDHPYYVVGRVLV